MLYYSTNGQLLYLSEIYVYKVWSWSYICFSLYMHSGKCKHVDRHTNILTGS